jgi:RIO-like serine/threonine protein kinase
MHAGRGVVPSLVLEPSQKRVVVRKYRRGGLLRFVVPDMFAGRHRSFQELAFTLRAARSGVPVAEILGALSLRVCGPLYRHYLVSRELTGYCDLAALFQERDCSDTDVEALARYAADRVRQVHDAGLFHGDLNLKNILVSRTDLSRLFIIDWDKSRYTPGSLGVHERRRNVVRFCRSAAKLRARGFDIPAQFAELFLEYYWGSSDMVHVCRQALRKALGRRRFIWRFLRKLPNA